MKNKDETIEAVALVLLVLVLGALFLIGYDILDYYGIGADGS